MATYWVQYTFSVAVESTGPQAPVATPQSILGHELVFGSPVVAIVADPTPFTTTFDREFYFDLVDLGVASPETGGTFRQIMRSSVTNVFLVGSAPDPTQLLGPEVTSDPLPPVFGSQIPGQTYHTFAWEKVTIPDDVALPTFKVATSSPGQSPYEDAVVVAESSNPGSVTVTLSSPADVPIDVHVDLQPFNWQSDVSLRDFTIPVGETSLTVPVAFGLSDNVLEPIERGTLFFEATAGSTLLASQPGDDTVPLLAQDALTLPEALSFIENGITRAKDFVRDFKATTEFSASFDPENPQIVNLKQALSITGKALDGALIAETFIKDVTSLRDADLVRAAADQLYTAGENVILSTIDKFLLKPAAVLVAAVSVAEAGLGVGILVQALGTEAAVGAAVLVEGSIGLTIGLGIASATTVAAAAAPLLVVAAAGWAAKAAYEELAPQILEQYKPGLEMGRSHFVEAVVEDVEFFSQIRVLDGYISGATIFGDDNDNGVLDPGEAFATTDARGGVTLAGGAGPLIAFGGVDMATGLPFLGQLSAPADSTVITPLTTLLNDLQSDPAAEQKILANLGLSPSLKLATVDPIAAAMAGDMSGAAAQVAGAKVYNTVSMIASALTGAGGALDASLKDAFSALASALAGSGSTLTDEAAITSLANDVAQSKDVELPVGLPEALAAVIVAGNIALDRVLHSDQNGNALLAHTAAIGLVIQGAASNAVKDLAAHPEQAKDVVDAFTGVRLDAAIAAALNQLSGNHAPTDIGLTSAAAAENLETGTVVGTLSASDPDAAETFTFALTDNAGGLFAINGANLIVAGLLNYESATSHNVTVRVTDSANNIFDKTFQIATTNVNEVPLVAPLVGKTNEDGPAFSQDLLIGSSDPDQGDQLAVSDVDDSVTTAGGRTLALGADYTLTGSTLALTTAGFAKFNSLAATQPDELVFQFNVSDGNLTTANTLTVAVDGANDAPSVASNGGGDSASVIITDDSKYVATVHATDQDAGASLTYSIAGGKNATSFAIDPTTGVLSFKSYPHDHRTYQVTVEASDGNLTDTQQINVSVGNGLFMKGHAGEVDTFVFAHFGLEIVKGFDATGSNPDVLELDHSLFHGADPNASASAMFELVKDHSFQLGRDVVIVTDTHEIIDLQNVRMSQLSADSFHII